MRCADTLRPYAALAGRPLRTRDGLSEEGYEADPSRVGRHFTRMLERGTAVALCSHGPLLPGLLEHLLRLVDVDEPDAAVAAGALRQAASEKMAKGELLVAHVVGTGEAARVVAVERHLP